MSLEQFNMIRKYILSLKLDKQTSSSLIAFMSGILLDINTIKPSNKNSKNISKPNTKPPTKPPNSS